MIDVIEIAKKAWGTDHEIFWFEDDGIERFAALYRQALIDSGELVEAEKVKKVLQPSPFLNRHKFGQCLICGLNHGGLPCPDNEVTSARSAK